MGAADPTPFQRDRAGSVVEEGNVSPGNLGHLHKSPLPPGFMSWGRRGLQRWGQGTDQQWIPTGASHPREYGPTSRDVFWN